jgi:hypothetical protein
MLLWILPEENPEALLGHLATHYFWCRAAYLKQ